ncbi:MAG: type II toxin-antitoxin system RelB family antitoxin [Burkholderiales bacterium]
MAKRLVEANAIRGASIVGMPGGWGVLVKYGMTECHLSAQRSKKVRMWRSLDSCVAYLKNELGIARIDGLDASNFSVQGLQERKRDDSAARMKGAHEAAAYDTWFRAQVQEAIDDPRSSIPHEEVMAEWKEERAKILRDARKTP